MRRARRIGAPSSEDHPASAFNRPAKMLMSVLLPAPFSADQRMNFAGARAKIGLDYECQRPRESAE